MKDQTWSAPETEIFETIRRAQNSDSQAVIAHIVGVEGNAYRRPGAKMVVSENRVGVGNITAGCLEGDVIDIASKVMKTGVPVIQTYDLMQDRDDMWGLGIGCNGIIDILIEQVNSSYKPVIEAIDNGNSISVITVLSGDVPIGTKAYYTLNNGMVLSPNFPVWLSNEVESEALSSTKTGKSTSLEITTSSGSVKVFIDGILPMPKILIIGSGNDVSPVVEVAKLNGFRVAIVGFRKGIKIDEKFPRADEFYNTSPASIAIDIPIDNNTSAILMTHNFIDDRISLGALINTPIDYIGLLGPQNRFEEMLLEFKSEGRDFSTEQLAKIYSPIGLDIGGGSPYQIATSIVSEILSICHNRVPGHLKNRKGHIHER